jgi:hypothetical protein
VSTGAVVMLVVSALLLWGGLVAGIVSLVRHDRRRARDGLDPLADADT